MGRRSTWLPSTRRTDYVFVEDLELDDGEALWLDAPDRSVIGPSEMPAARRGDLATSTRAGRNGSGWPAGSPFVSPELARSRPHRGTGAGRGWKEQVARVRTAMERALDEAEATPWPAGREIVYVLDAEATVEHSGLVVELRVQDTGRATAGSRLKPLRLGWHEVGRLPDPRDQRVFALLRTAASAASSWIGHTPYGTVPSACVMPPTLWEPALSAMIETGRCGFRSADDTGEPIRLRRDGGDPWTLTLEMSRDGAGARYLVTGGRRPDPHTLGRGPRVAAVLSGTRSAWPTPASNPRSAPPAIPTTTRSRSA